MPRLKAEIAKKLPVPGVNFSSISCGVGIELEVPEGQSVGELKARYEKMLTLLTTQVDAYFAAQGADPSDSRFRSQ